jgi:hypothetical protein
MPRLRAVGLPSRVSIRCKVFSPKPVCRASSLKVILFCPTPRLPRDFRVFRVFCGSGSPSDLRVQGFKTLRPFAVLSVSALKSGFPRTPEAPAEGFEDVRVVGREAIRAIVRSRESEESVIRSRRLESRKPRRWNKKAVVDPFIVDRIVRRLLHHRRAYTKSSPASARTDSGGRQRENG